MFVQTEAFEHPDNWEIKTVAIVNAMTKKKYKFFKLLVVNC